MTGMIRLALGMSGLLACLALAVPPALEAHEADQVRAQSPAFDAGYRDGLSHGQRDARERRGYDFQSNEYRRGDRGYNRRFGDRDADRRDYRDAYVRGYADGYYGRTGRATPGVGGRAIPRGAERYPGGGYPSYPYPSPQDPYGYPSRSPRDPYGYPGRGTDPYGYGRYSYGFDTGYADGYEQGLEDGEDGDRFDPVRHRRYRSGDHGYEREYGTREQYKNEYRAGFRQGYDRGYEDARRYGRSGRVGPRSRTGGLPWPF